MSEDMSPGKIILFILYAVAMAMGVASIILPMLGQTVDPILLGIAVFCLSLAGLNAVQEKS
ncbi:MAG: hypothetical protein ACW98Y_08825 [Candidatus Thorarchaeota archaeon]|jgi:hypothetical protein